MLDVEETEILFSFHPQSAKQDVQKIVFKQSHLQEGNVFFSKSRHGVHKTL